MTEIMMILQGMKAFMRKYTEYIKMRHHRWCRIPRGERLPSTRLLANPAVTEAFAGDADRSALWQRDIYAANWPGFLYAISRELYRAWGSSVSRNLDRAKAGWKTGLPGLIFPRMRSIPAVFRTTSGGRSAMGMLLDDSENC